MINQLAGTDSVFLSMETEEFHGHTGGLLILDPTGAPGFGFERVKSILEERLGLAPRFRWKLKQVPFGLDRPYWVEDTDFDLSRHLHRIAVPSPGGMRQVADVCSYLFGHKLDLTRPLWEIWYIEGLQNGRVALFAKTHHCLLDGVSGSDLGMLLCDLDANPAPRSYALPETMAPSAPGELPLLLHGIANLAATPLRVAQYAGQALQRGITTLTYATQNDGPPLPGNAPRLSFNASVGARRGFACASVSMSDIRRLKSDLGVKINDIILELSASAVRRYLQYNREPIPPSLIVTCAVSTRDPNDKDLGNKIANMNVACRTDIKDPVERVRRIHASAEGAKHWIKAVRATPIRALGDTLPPAFINFGFRTGSAFSEMIPLWGNLVVSNVPGPPVPLYSAGARIEALYPFSLLAASQGLNITVLSYMDRMDFGLTVEPELVRDPWFLAEAIPLALADLKAAAERRATRRRRRQKPAALPSGETQLRKRVARASDTPSALRVVA